MNTVPSFPLCSIGNPGVVLFNLADIALSPFQTPEANDAVAVLTNDAK